MANRKGLAGIIFIVILVALAVIMGVAFLYVNRNILPTKNETIVNKTLEANNSFIKFRALEYGTNKQIEANYELWINKSYYEVINYPNGTVQSIYHEQITKLRQGRSKSFVYEFLTQLEKNQSFIIYAWDEDKRERDYYFDFMDCKSNYTCEIGLKKQAIVNISSSAVNGSGIIKVKAYQGTIKDSIILFSYPYYVKNVQLTNRARVEVPKDKKLYFDRSYLVDDITETEVSIPFTYEKEQDEEAEINITIIDMCYLDKVVNYEKSNSLGIEDISTIQKI